MSHQYPKHRRSPAVQRRISARGVRRQPPKLEALSRALLQVAFEAAAAEAAAEAEETARQRKVAG